MIPLPFKPSRSLQPIRLFCTSSSNSMPMRTRAATLVRDGLKNSRIPEYPYGPSLIYKQSNHGLYGLQKIRFGNKVSERNEIKTRRCWRPNVQRKSLYSACLDRLIRVRVTMRTLRTIDKNGGLDSYLLGGKARRLKELGQMGWALRWRVMISQKGRERLRQEGREMEQRRHRLGGITGTLEEKEEERKVAEEVRRFDEVLDAGEEIAVDEASEAVLIADGPEIVAEEPDQEMDTAKPKADMAV